MDKDKLNKLLKEAELSRKDLAGLLECATQTVNNWGSTQNIPYWVESWLENYIEKKKFETMKQTLRASGVCE
jgi:macrodomain Ter protein organizer (MatP/YcbG family)